MYYPSYIFVLQDHRLGGCTIWPSDFSPDQLVGPLDSWLRHRPVGWTFRHSLLLSAHFVADQLVGLLGTWFFANQLVGLSVASNAGGSPAKLGTSFADSLIGLLRFADASCYVWYQGFPCYPDRGADLGRHVRGFDKYIYRSNLVLSTFYFLHALLLDIIEFYSTCLVLSTRTSSSTLNSLILLQDATLSYSRLRY